MPRIKSKTPFNALTNVGAVSRYVSAGRVAAAACLKEFCL